MLRTIFPRKIPFVLVSIISIFTGMDAFCNDDPFDELDHFIVLGTLRNLDIKSATRAARTCSRFNAILNLDYDWLEVKKLQLPNEEGVPYPLALALYDRERSQAFNEKYSDVLNRIGDEPKRLRVGRAAFILTQESWAKAVMEEGEETHGKSMLNRQFVPRVISMLSGIDGDVVSICRAVNHVLIPGVLVDVFGSALAGNNINNCDVSVSVSLGSFMEDYKNMARINELSDTCLATRSLLVNKKGWENYLGLDIAHGMRSIDSLMVMVSRLGMNRRSICLQAIPILKANVQRKWLPGNVLSIPPLSEVEMVLQGVKLLQTDDAINDAVATTKELMTEKKRFARLFSIVASLGSEKSKAQITPEMTDNDLYKLSKAIE